MQYKPEGPDVEQSDSSLDDYERIKVPKTTYTGLVGYVEVAFISKDSM